MSEITNKYNSIKTDARVSILEGVISYEIVADETERLALDVSGATYVNNKTVIYQGDNTAGYLRFLLTDKANSTPLDRYTELTYIASIDKLKTVLVADQTARYALTTDQVQNGTFILQQDINSYFGVIDQTQLSGVNGYIQLQNLITIKNFTVVADSNTRLALTGSEYQNNESIVYQGSDANGYDPYILTDKTNISQEIGWQKVQSPSLSGVTKVADQTARLALTTPTNGDIIYQIDTKELYAVSDQNNLNLNASYDNLISSEQTITYASGGLLRNSVLANKSSDYTITSADIDDKSVIYLTQSTGNINFTLSTSGISVPAPAESRSLRVVNTATPSSAIMVNGKSLTTGFLDFIFISGAWVSQVDYLSSSSIVANLKAVIDNTIATPPSTPSINDAYIVAATATDAWATKENQIAVYNGNAWLFYTPSNGDKITILTGTNASSLATYSTGTSSWTIAPVAVQAEFGESILGSTVEVPSDTSSSTATNIIDFTLPSAGVWEVNYIVRAQNNTVGFVIESALYSDGTLIANSEILSAYLQSIGAATGTGCIRITTTGSQSISLKAWASSSGGGILSDLNGRTSVKWKKISGLLPVSALPAYTEWASFTPVIKGSATNPTKATTSWIKGRYKIVGKSMFMQFSYGHASALGANIGIGTYYIEIPGGYTINTTLASIPTSENSYHDGLHLGGGNIQQDGAAGQISVQAYSSNAIQMVALYNNNSIPPAYGPVSSSYFHIEVYNTQYNFYCEIPIN